MLYSSKTLIILFFVILSANVFSYERMTMKGYTSCIACHDSPAGGGMLTAYGKLISASQGLIKSSPQEGSFKQRITMGGKLDHSAQIRIAHIRREDSQATFPMQADYLAAFRGKSITVLSQVAKAPKRKSSTTVETDASFVDTLYFRELKLIGKINKNNYISIGRERQNLGLKLIDHTVYTKNYNKFNATDLVTAANYFYINQNYELGLTAYGPNGQEQNSDQEKGVKFNIQKKLTSSVFGLTALSGKTDGIDKTIFGTYGKFKLFGPTMLFYEFFRTDRELTAGTSFKQTSAIAGLTYLPQDYLAITVSTEHLHRRSPFLAKLNRYTLTSQFKLTKTTSIQLDYKRTKLETSKQKLIVAQTFFNIW